MLAFEANPREIFGKRDASAADAAISRILKDREMGRFVGDFKQKYDAFIDWPTVNLSKKQIKPETRINCLCHRSPTLVRMSNRIANVARLVFTVK